MILKKNTIEKKIHNIIPFTFLNVSKLERKGVGGVVPSDFIFYKPVRALPFHLSPPFFIDCLSISHQNEE